MGAKNRVGIGLSYRPARLHTVVPRRAESIPGILKSLKILALDFLKVKKTSQLSVGAQAIPLGNHLSILELLAALTALTASHVRSKLEKIKANKGNVNKIMLQQTAFTTELSYAASCHTYFSDSVFLYSRAFT
jgi:hypothetical protein